MDFRMNAEEEAFRKEVSDFIRKEWDSKGFYGSDLGPRSLDSNTPESRENEKAFQDKLASKGWYTMHWPVEWGGQDASFGKQFVYREELAYAGAPGGSPGGNISGAIMFHGSDELKNDLLPKMARNEITWAQGFSEPNAGTDLANLSTRAVEDGDDFVVTGQKIWSSSSTFADWYHVLVRTDPDAPKHRGITYLAMPFKDNKGNNTPGVTLRPLYDFIGHRRWNEVFMDEVRVPKKYVIGEVNRGWYAAMTALNFERTGVDGPARHIGLLDRFISLCRETKFNGQAVLDNPLVKHRLADLRVMMEADRMLAYRVGWMQSAGLVPQHEGAMSGYANQLTSKFHFWHTLAKVMGDYRVLAYGEHRAPHNGVYGTYSMIAHTVGFGGGGGILLSPNIIAQRGLGLPR